MKAYLARQPILDRSLNVIGYELLLRSSQSDSGDSTEDLAITSEVIVKAVLEVGLDRLVRGKPAFINFNRTLLLGEWITILPPGQSIIQILESVPPDPEVLAACGKFREQGYALALDGCLNDQRTRVFAQFIDILKVDFQNTSPADQEQIARRCQKLRIRTVAKRVETEPQFRRASHMGYDYFEGYFFNEPAILQAVRVPASQVNALHLVEQLKRQELNYRALEDLIQRDVPFSHSLLKYVNSAAFEWTNRVDSIRHSMVLLGTNEIRKWGWMASLSSLGESRPAVLMTQVLMRGRFCETIAATAKLPLGGCDPFLFGVFSLLDAILGKPLQGILEEFSIDRNIRNALLGTADEAEPLALLLRVVKSYETGDWNNVEAAGRLIGLTADELGDCYLDSLSWVDALFSSDEKQHRPVRLTAPNVFRRAQENPLVAQ